MKLKQLNIASMISILSLFAITGNSKLTSSAMQNGDEDQAARRMRSSIQGCKDCQCRGVSFIPFVSFCHLQIIQILSGFPEGKYQIHLKSETTDNNRLLKNVVFDHQTGTISGNWDNYSDYQIQNGFHDCEHAYFEVIDDNSKLQSKVVLVCNAWGTGYPKIDEMIATCTYVWGLDYKIAEFTGKFIPM